MNKKMINTFANEFEKIGQRKGRLITQIDKLLDNSQVGLQQQKRLLKLKKELGG